LSTKCWSETFVLFRSLRHEPPSTIAVFEGTPGFSPTVFSPIVKDVLSPGEYSKVCSQSCP
jgi:hypothetical protein